MAYFIRGIALVMTLAITLPSSGMAQSAYDAGYNAGYNDHWPTDGYVDMTTSYGRGFTDGQDDSYEDEERHQRIMDSDGIDK